MEKHCYVFVHAGAGSHSEKREKVYKDSMKRACTLALDLLNSGGSSEAADSPCTNAGIGSNLTRSGTVQCDASIMRSKDGAFGSVGAVSAIKNPISAASKLMETESRGQVEFGLITPMMLVGQGAEIWSVKNGVECTSDTQYHITNDSKNKYAKYMEIIKDHTQNPISAAIKTQECMQDTVGAICLDLNGNMASGVSSGGIAIKLEGRVGEVRFSISSASIHKKN
ncbi:hypothetical protein BB558_001258 [Smittium angustum]|uniref:Uncharacterized protein n=1 Tax=Smittium angustum TaxID=133377 RepID=A0A2U1JCC1_SMIAN|nr:hypothetical protein BB558_001258 [Smittium angustum]